MKTYPSNGKHKNIIFENPNDDNRESKCSNSYNIKKVNKTNI